MLRESENIFVDAGTGVSWNSAYKVFLETFYMST